MKPSSSNEIVHDFYPLFKVYKDGHIERYTPPIDNFVPPGTTLKFGVPVTSKDIIISQEQSISARIFLPQNPNQSPNRKLTILIYFHGGGFALGSAFDPVYNDYVASLAVKSNSIAISINYKLAPENPIPACYDDSCVAFQWVASHSTGQGSDPWLNRHGDFERVFMGGDSAGANIAHYVALRTHTLMRSFSAKLGLKGLILVHPSFGGTKYDEYWLWMCPTNRGTKDPRLYPTLEDMELISFEEVLVAVASEDPLRNCQRFYYENLKRSKWKGSAEIVEQEGVGHTFYLFSPHCELALNLMDKLSSFINQDQATFKSKI